MFKKMSILFFLMSMMVGFCASATGTDVLLQVTKKYRNSKVVKMAVEKVVKSELLGKETKYSGTIYITSGKFRWENTTPEKTLLVFDGKTIWSEQTPPKEFGGPVQVAKGKVDKKTSSHILISALFGADLDKNFKVVKEDKEGELLKLFLNPRGDELTIKSLQVVVNPKQNTLDEISYMDDIGNLTTMRFSNMVFLKKTKKNLFKYQPPKGAQVTDL